MFLLFLLSLLPCVQTHLCRVSAPLDVWILFDGSSSTRQNFNDEVLLTANLIDSLPPASRVSTIQFASWTQTHSALTPFDKFSDVRRELFNAKPLGGSSQLGYGLFYTRRYEMTLDAGNRPDVPDYVIVIMGSTSVDDPYPAAEVIRKTFNASTICVGVVEHADEVQLLEIAGDPRSLITVPKSEDLGDMWLVEDILEMMCPGSTDPDARLNPWQISYCDGVEECAFIDHRNQLHQLCKCWSDAIGHQCSPNHPYIKHGHRCHTTPLPVLSLQDKSCEDTSKACLSWAAQGQCQISFTQMYQDCPKTCGLCDHKPCEGIERCATERSGKTESLCRCSDSTIGTRCGSNHPWGGSAYRCHPSSQITSSSTPPLTTLSLISPEIQSSKKEIVENRRSTVIKKSF